MNKLTSFLAIAFFISAGVNAAETTETHQQAAMVHETVNNSGASAHQQIAQKHEMLAHHNNPAPVIAPAFSQMDEHEKAMVVHQSMNNGHAYAHELEAEKHRKRIPAQG